MRTLTPLRCCAIAFLSCLALLAIGPQVACVSADQEAAISAAAEERIQALNEQVASQREALESAQGAIESAQSKATAAAARQRAAEQALLAAQASGDPDALATAEAESSAATAEAAKATKEAKAAKATAKDAEKSVALTTKVRDALVKGTEFFKATINPDGSINVEPAAQIISGFIPPPWNILAYPLLAAGGGWIGNEIRKRMAAKQVAAAQAEADAALMDASDHQEAAKSLVNAIDVLRTASPDVRTAMATAKDAFRAALTPLAKNIVEAERLT